ncbi:MAG TPA: hypothetical protein VG184_00660 [Acidimicrobiales bacterium]|jgi:RNA polymerase-binding transcription factor DksA|nr:hypothetical protein [Acidimicrobiales bacterium]
MPDPPAAGAGPPGNPPLDRQRDLALIGEVAEHLNAVEAALRRLDDGTYGRCVRCGAAIADERLAEDPEAAECGEHSGPD